MTFSVRQWLAASQGIWAQLSDRKMALLSQFRLQAESTDYRAWRHRFMLDRLRLCLWIAILSFLTFFAQDIYSQFLSPERFENNITRFYGDTSLVDLIRSGTIATNLTVGALLALCVLLYRTRWGQRYPVLLFLCVSWSVTLAPQMVATFYRLPNIGVSISTWVLIFLTQATLIPVRWRLHLISQFGAIAYYGGINPLLGLTEIQGQSIYSPGRLVFLFWACLICDLAVYLYERLKQSEFEAQRQLQIFLHSVSHDLQTPVMGTSMVLKSLLSDPADQLMVDRAILERLLDGSDRQSNLINTLLEAHTGEVHLNQLHCERLPLQMVIDSVLSNLHPVLSKHQVQLVNQISPDLPAIYADESQIWRVFCNLITNALKHNPNGICLTLNAELIPVKDKHHLKQFWQSLAPVHTAGCFSHMLRCSVQDNGVGIPPDQTRKLFELYSRGFRARYMPGLGLGLYLCRQIVQAHGGQIGVISEPGEGSTFWFTLPIAPSR
jgi:signal transduction histidine kinase